MSDPSEQPWLTGLSSAQAAVATYSTGPQLVTAGPGSGKTRTLCAWIVELIRTQRVSPEDILAVTFTRRAARELTERLAVLLSPIVESLLIGTFHRLALRLAPLPPPLRVIEEAERLEMIEHAVAGTGCRKSPSSLLSLLSLRKGQHPDYGALLASGTLDVSEEERLVLGRYEALLAERGAVDLDDLLLRAVQALREGTALRQFRFVAVDEYQDVSATQRALVVELGRTATVLAIGDPDQAIYAFRGGEVRHFLGFAADFPAARSRFLVENHRSSPQIVAASAAVIAHNPGRLAPAPVPCRPAGEPLTLLRSPSLRSEAQRIVREIEQLIGGSSLLAHDRRQTASWRAGSYGFSDVAILTRNVARAELISQALREAGLPLSRPSEQRRQPSIVPGESIEPVYECDQLEDQRIAVLTLHGAKGLEFPVVFVAGLEAGQLPGPGRSEEQSQEERRLLYVGLTRAKELLYLSYLETAETSPSPFLRELPSELIVCEAPAKRRPQKPQLRLF